MYKENKIELTKNIKEKALEVGFDLVGITSAKPFVRAQKILKKRKKGKLSINDIKLWTTPSLHLSSAKSIIALGLSYATSNKSFKKCGIEKDSVISLYARGKDYHHVIDKKQKKLIRYIKDIKPEAKLIDYCDTGKILDREVAYRAGLGWIGKNNNIINPQYGSYLFLGEIITNLELVSDKPVKPQCNNCKKCLENCPGQALVSPYKLDPDKCISFLTQKKGILSKEQKKKIDNRLWGCDICMETCPYNKNVPVDIHPEFKPIIKGDINKLLNFSCNNIEEKWLNSALSWRGLRILKRNALINIANSGKIIYIPLLEKILTHPSLILRRYAVWALGEIKGQKAKKVLSKRLEIENEKIVIKEINNTIKKIKESDNCD